MTSKMRVALQRKLLIRHYRELLEPGEAKVFRNSILKTGYTLVGCICTIPIVAYNIFKFNAGDRYRTGLRNGMIIQLFFTLLNYKFSRDYFKQEDEIHRKYLSFLPEAALLDFENSYLPGFIE